jgi:hypothetical protein
MCARDPGCGLGMLAAANQCMFQRRKGTRMIVISAAVVRTRGNQAFPTVLRSGGGGLGGRDGANKRLVGGSGGRLELGTDGEGQRDSINSLMPQGCRL